MALMDFTQRQRREELCPSLGKWIKDTAKGIRHKGFATLAKSLEIMVLGTMDLPENQMLIELAYCRGFKRGLAPTKS